MLQLDDILCGQKSGRMLRTSSWFEVVGRPGQVSEVKLASLGVVQVSVAEMASQPILAVGCVLAAGRKISEGVVDADAPVDEGAVLVD